MVKETIGGIIQARMGSTRLPGKMLIEIMGKPLIQHVIDRVSQSKRIDKLILATTNNPRDAVLVDIARKNYWFCIDTDKMHILAPLMLSFHAFHRRDPRALLDILECSCIDGQEKTMKLIELNQRYKEKGLLSLPVLVRYKHMAEAWHTATTEQKMLIEKYRLAQTF